MKRIFILPVIAQTLAFASAKAQTLDGSKIVNEKLNSLVGTWKPTF